MDQIKNTKRDRIRYHNEKWARDEKSKPNKNGTDAINRMWRPWMKNKEKKFDKDDK